MPIHCVSVDTDSLETHARLENQARLYGLLRTALFTTNDDLQNPCSCNTIVATIVPKTMGKLRGRNFTEAGLNGSIGARHQRQTVSQVTASHLC